MNIKLYSSPTCPKCKMLATKMERKGIEFEKIIDEEIIIGKGLKSIPWLEVDGTLFDCHDANDWINAYKED